MNGLNAIKLMMEDENKCVTCSNDFLYRIRNGNVEVKCSLNNNWEIDTHFNFEDDYTEYINSNDQKRLQSSEYYYYINERGHIITEKELYEKFDDELFDSYNYFDNKELAENISKEQLLYRKFNEQRKETDSKYFRYYIAYSVNDKKFDVNSVEIKYKKIPGVIYFNSKETAYLAIEMFKKDLESIQYKF